MDPVSAKELKERIRKERTFEVSGMAFRIRKVPLLLLADESDDLWELARQGAEALSQRIKALVSSPSLPRLRRILLAGVIQPRLSAQEEEDAVCVDMLLSDYPLSTGLFIEVLNFSLET